MPINPTIFRCYDIRGVYPQDLSEEAAYRTARAFCQLYPQAKKIAVASDTRLSSPALLSAVIKGLVDGGKDVLSLGVGPDPLFYFSIFHYHLDGGIMVSGSHNPKEYNGLMITVKKPELGIVEDIINEDLDKIKELVLSSEGFSLPASHGSIHDLKPKDDYIDYVTKIVKLKKPLKIVIDSSNGACGYLPEEIFKKLGCKVKTLFGEFDGAFPNHLPDPYLEENLKALKQEVLEEKADLGFCFDTDGDRVALVDNRGRSIDGDFCMLMLARNALAKKKGPIVHDMRISKAFLDEIAKEDAPNVFSVCHHNAVIENIIKHKAVFGGEITLHFFFPLDYYLADDAVFSALKMAEVASNHGNLADFVDSLPRYFASPEIFIDAPDEKKYAMIADFVNYLRSHSYNFVDVDGARVNFQHGWALMRASNTSPMIKCRFEGDSPENLFLIGKEMVEVFERVGLPVSDKIYQELGLTKNSQ